MFEEFALVHRPVAVGKNLDFIEAAKAGLLDPAANFGDFYYAFAHETAVVEHVHRLVFPVADVEGEELAFTAAPGADVTPRPIGAHIFAAEYFAEEVRREVYERYGEKKLYEGGLSVRTTLNPKLQLMAKKALSDGLVRFDEAKGWRGAPANIQWSGNWGAKLADQRALSDISWRLALVLEVSDQAAKIGLQPTRGRDGQITAERATGAIPLDAVKWAKWTDGPERGKAIAKEIGRAHV